MESWTTKIEKQSQMEFLVYLGQDVFSRHSWLIKMNNWNEKMIFVLELKMILSSRQEKAITSKVCLARSKLFPGSSRQPASTIMNWNNIYWKGIGRPPVGWLRSDSQQQFTTFSQNFKLSSALKVCMSFDIWGRRGQRRNSGWSQSIVSEESCIHCDCSFTVNI